MVYVKHSLVGKLNWAGGGQERTVAKIGTGVVN